jgi:alkylation response protein AidB-like acyl-CoA dehydrogenase
MVTGEWTATMNLTDPDAGSDLGAIRTKAVPDENGTWRINGQKVFITYGEHDLADNIVHLVLACVPDAPAGTGGISCFIVPKVLIGEDRQLGQRNRVATRMLAAGSGTTDFLQAKLVTAHFYCEQLLPQASGLLSAVGAGAGDLLALSPAQF